MDLVEIATRDGNGVLTLGAIVVSGWLGSLLLRRLLPLVPPKTRWGVRMFKVLVVVWVTAVWTAFYGFFELAGMREPTAVPPPVGSPGFELFRWWFMAAFPLALICEQFDRSRYAVAVKRFHAEVAGVNEHNFPPGLDMWGDPLTFEDWRWRVWGEVVAATRTAGLTEWPKPT